MQIWTKSIWHNHDFSMKNKLENVEKHCKFRHFIVSNAFSKSGFAGQRLCSSCNVRQKSGRWGETDFEKGPVDLFPVEPTDEAFMPRRP